MEFAEEVVKEADQYNGFNLIVADLCSKSMIYLTNRPKEANVTVAEVKPGIYVLSNASLDTPWPKVRSSVGFCLHNCDKSANEEEILLLGLPRGGNLCLPLFGH